MSLEYFRYVVGYGTTKGKALWITYSPNGSQQDTRPHVSVEIEGPRGAQGPYLTPIRMLDFRLHVQLYKTVNGILQGNGTFQEPPGWFERMCVDANCTWFVDYVRRMAAGETFSFDEIKHAYLLNNDRKMLFAQRWGEAFDCQSYLQWVAETDRKSNLS